MKNNDTHDLRVSARTARLTAGQDDDDEPPWRFSGIAVAAGDILHMDDGTRVLMTAEELQKAAESQAGEPLTTDHPEDDDGRPVYPPPTEETVGKVPKAGWIEEADAVGYEATTHDRDIADGVRGGTYEVSVHPRFQVEPYDDPEADVKASNIKFLDLSVVSKGDSPSNTAEWGPNEALASFTHSTDFRDQLTAAYDDGAADDDTESLVERLARKFGIIGDRGDRRGFIRVEPQTSDGEAIRVAEAGFEDARWMACAHLEGTEYPDIGPGLSPSIGEADAVSAGELLTDQAIDLDEPLEEDADVYVALHYASEDGEMLDLITSADGGYFYDSAFVGVAPAEADVTAGTGGGQKPGTQTMGAESSVDDSPTTDMDDNTREQYITFLTANADFDKESLEAMDDNVLEQTYELAAEDAASNGGSDGGSNDDPDNGGDGKTLGEMTPAEAKVALEEQGFVTEDNAGDLVAQAQEEATKGQKVDEIIAHSDQYDEDDREDLMASADALVDREHDHVAGDGGMGLPGAAGITASASPAAGGAEDNSEEDPDEYGTGVAEN
ncbi:hypothetical protein C478_10466 [Natrinema thermotolerans DSM 11552]|nr:hypothetical protein C478_10466 [Natrinema thermotolerans DSM 11552]